MKKKAIFIINLISGTSDKAAIPELIEQLLDKEKFEYEIAITTEKIINEYFIDLLGFSLLSTSNILLAFFLDSFNFRYHNFGKKKIRKKDCKIFRN